MGRGHRTDSDGGTDVDSVRGGRSAYTASSSGFSDFASSHPLPVFGVGSARYGLLGGGGAVLEHEPDDPLETLCGSLRLVQGYGGGAVSDMQVRGRYTLVHPGTKSKSANRHCRI